MHEGREQGADMGAEVVYVREFEGEHQERRAYTAADRVNLEARGWRRQDTGQQTTSGQGASPAKAAPTASSSASPVAPKPVAPAAGASTEGNGPA